MRLDELFVDKPFIVEAPDDGNIPVPPKTVNISLADIYKMTNRTPPAKMGPNGQLIYPKGFHDKKTYEVGGGSNQVDPKIATAIKEYQDGGEIKGVIMRDNELRPYDENSTLVDLGWAFAAGTAELASSWMKGGSYVIDDAINNLTVAGRLAKAKGEKLSDISKSTLSGYNNPEMDDQGEYTDKSDKFFMDRFQEYLINKTDQSFRDNVDLTTGAVTDFNSAVGLFMGATGFNLEGAAGVIIGELPSEIVDVITITTTGPIAGMAISTKLNALEAGGAVAQSITDRVNKAFNDGKLQQTGHFAIYKEAAIQQLQEDGEDRTPQELEEEAKDLARKFAIDASIRNAFYKVAATGGVLDTIQNKVLYGKVIKPKFMKNAIMKAKIGTLTEGASEAAEQWFENGGIIDGAGNITTRTEGVVNAAYNGMLAAQSGNITAATVGGAQRIRAGAARLRQFVLGGSKDPKAIVDLMTINPNELMQLVTRVDENGVRRFAISELVKARTIGTADIEEAKKNGARVNRRGQYTITKDGKTVKITVKEAQQNDKDIELISILDDNELDPDEGIVVVNVGDKNEVRRVAALLGIDNKGSINAVLKRIEDVRKIDVRVKGRSTLEAPIFSDLTDQQKLQYWKEGKVTFTGDKERGNQTWTRNQIMFNSRRNGDTIPEDLENLADNTFARPDLNSEEYADMAGEIRNLELQIENSIAMRMAKKKLADDQKEWDAEAKKNGVEATTAEFGPRPSRDMPGDPYNFTGARASTAIIENELNRIKRDFARDQKAWDTEFGETHFADGSVKKGREYFDEKFKAEQAAREVEKEKLEKIKSENADVDGIDVMTAPPTSPELNPANEENNSLSRAHIVASTKLEISTREMKPEAVRAMLKNLEKAYPGISNDIITQEDLAKYEQLPKEVREKLNNEAQQNPPEKFQEPQLDRPPTGIQVELDGVTYAWQGVPNGVGGMWAVVNADGSRGTTNHQNHKTLMKMWKDSTIDKTKPVKITPPEADEFDADDEALRSATKEKQKQANTNNVTNIANNGEPAEQEGDTEQKFFNPSQPTAADQQYKDVVVPQSVQDQYKEVLATKNSIKIDRFLKGLPANQAGSLRMNPPVTTTVDDPSTKIPQTPPKVTTTAPDTPEVPQGDNELDIDVQPEQDPKITTRKPDELEVPDVQQPKTVKPDELTGQPPKVTTTAPEKPTTPQDDDSMDAPELDIGVDKPVTTKQPPNLVAPNTDPEAGGPVNFIDPKTLTTQQKKELDDIAKRNQADQEKAAGTDAETRAQQAKDKLKQNQDKLDKVTQQADTDTDDSMDADDTFTGGINAPTNTTNMTGQQNNPNDTSTDTDATQTVEPGTNQSQADMAMGLTGPVATKTVQLKKGKKRQTDTQQDKTPRPNAGIGKDDDQTDFKDMLRFNPAKYRDPLDLEKYKGGMQKQMGFTGGQS